MTPNLRIDDVSKRYGSNTWALEDVSLDLGPGIHGLLGPNGAGKSTLMQIITTYASPTGGTVTWNGVDVHSSPHELRSVLGYLPQRFGIYPNLTAAEFLSYLAALRGLRGARTRERINDLLEVTNLQDVRDQRVGSYSGGMRRRLGVAQALLSDPDILIVDEPTAGLDPQERIRFRNVLGELGGGRVVLLSTHVVGDVEATATKVAVMDEGRIVTHDHPKSVIERVSDAVWEWTVPADELPDLKRQYLTGATTRQEDGIRVRVVSETRPDSNAEQAQPTLEEAYMHAVSEGFH